MQAHRSQETRRPMAQTTLLSAASGLTAKFLVAPRLMASSIFSTLRGSDEVASADDPIPNKPDFQPFF
jgi:hypothetical protein